MPDLPQYALNTAQKARDASRALVNITGQQKNAWLTRAAELLLTRTDELIAANQQDILKAPEFGLSHSAAERLRLTESRIKVMADALVEIVALPDPIGEVIDGQVRPNGLRVTRVRVPLGVVFFIYESRPNVTVDAAALCVKSGNAVILRGGKEALHSNLALHRLLTEALRETGLPTNAIQLVTTIDRELIGHFLKLNQWIDLTIPRGGKSLIELVAANATMPVLKHFEGICHVYVDHSADMPMAEAILVNSKCQRPGVCNAAETLLVHAGIAKAFLPRVAETLGLRGVELRCCPRSLTYIQHGIPATEQDFRTEFLELTMSVKIVHSLDEAIRHINEYGSHHTDAIVTNDLNSAEQFCREVDSAATHVNCSTRFNDGHEYGLGAEIGISTDKFHARGPCGLRELTSYKWIVHGTGQVRG
ncbi:MAG: glutamate-5-semialdehyde dehydrogenase [Planctomycetaceae bacterium]